MELLDEELFRFSITGLLGRETSGLPDNDLTRGFTESCRNRRNPLVTFVDCRTDRNRMISMSAVLNLTNRK